MINTDLLNLVQPPDGWFAVVGIGASGTKQKMVATLEEVQEEAEKLLEQKRDVYFGVAKYASNTGRKKDNVLALRALWVDIDCGEGKAEVDPITGVPKGYVDQSVGAAALKEFCEKVGFPLPTLVNSGRGLHAYWPLVESITRHEWELVASRLREVCVAQKLYVDSSVFEAARVLRIPGTFNFKSDPPQPVSVLCTSKPTPISEIRAILGVKPEPVKAVPPAPKRELSELAKAMAQNTSSSFKKIMSRGNEGCAQLINAYRDRATLSEPRWFAALSIAKFCSDKNTAIHRISEGHPDYDYATTEAKVGHIVGPHSCAEFERSNPGGCDGCPHKGKIKSPITLGNEFAQATAEDNVVVVKKGQEDEESENVETHIIPDYPFPFFRGKNGGIYKQAEGDEEEPTKVYENDLYVVKRMRDPILGDVVVMKLHLPKDGVKEFVLSNAQVIDKNELRKVLASHGVVCGIAASSLLMTFIILSIKDLQFRRRAEQMRTQFGWADKDSKFIIGDREVTPDGVFHSPPSSTTHNIAQLLQPKGSLEKWKEVFNLYGRPGLEAHAFAALTAFGSPLLKFLGQNGAIINVIHPSSGTGKTTILHMCNSVYGEPSRLCAMWDDTLNAKIMKLGVMNNLPFTVDEMTNTTPADFSTLAYSMSQGRGKDRVKASANELRANLTSWQCTSLCSSNASFYEKLSSLKSSPDGEIMLLIEYKIDYSNAIDAAYAKHMFDHQLKDNYGHAGEIYAKWLVANLEEAKNTVLQIQLKIDRELKLTQRERFWSAVVASNIAGGLVARSLGLIQWDMKAIYAWATQMILGLRSEVKPPVNDIVTVVGDYINRHMQNIVVVNDAVDRRTGILNAPILEPRGELLIRYEPDTKKMYFAAKAFRDDCVKFQINYRDTLKQLESKGIYEGAVNKRLSKGMKVVSPGVHSLVFDCSNSDFIDMDSITGGDDAGGEG